MSLDVRIPILAVLGRKNSGKTTVAERIVSTLVKRGLKVAVAKHISKKGFSMDSEGKDTWRYSDVGATPVIAVSDRETTVKLMRGTDVFSLDWMLRVSAENDADVLVIEGFSSIILKDKRVGKIICMRNSGEYYEYKEKVEGGILAYCSFKSLDKPILEINRDLKKIVNEATKFINKRWKIFSILSDLPRLDCRKCGRSSCLELAEAIYAGEAGVEECVPLKLKPTLKTKIIIEENEVPIQPFVSEVIRRSVLGMISALKEVNISGEEEIRIEISK
ncbi:TPA: molybdopterin-guanine dinucleotide biosynthesis protein B [Candidatus Bathyarchaeota archaeon]|nr:molybdopterin-guanine dinucleotide biosynthesis protein B [Candidatus Bathyarchaeota archaeon]